MGSVGIACAQALRTGRFGWRVQSTRYRKACEACGPDRRTESAEPGRVSIDHGRAPGASRSLPACGCGRHHWLAFRSLPLWLVLVSLRKRGNIFASIAKGSKLSAIVERDRRSRLLVGHLFSLEERLVPPTPNSK